MTLIARDAMTDEIPMMKYQCHKRVAMPKMNSA